jgi:hypothetical protein
MLTKTVISATFDSFARAGRPSLMAGKSFELAAS